MLHIQEKLDLGFSPLYFAGERQFPALFSKKEVKKECCKKYKNSDKKKCKGCPKRKKNKQN
jgi:ferric iron reductase protein FhuF